MRGCHRGPRLRGRRLAAAVALCLTGSALAATALTGTAVAGGDAGTGRAVFVRQCAICHSPDKDGGNRFGPNLFGVVGRTAGTAPGFAYSAAFKTQARWEWSEAALGGFVTAPSVMIHGTAMGVFQGIATRDRDDLLAYLSTLK
jgi:cytochrome c